jgi:hypothetical protein
MTSLEIEALGGRQVWAEDRRLEAGTRPIKPSISEGNGKAGKSASRRPVRAATDAVPGG